MTRAAASRSASAPTLAKHSSTRRAPHPERFSPNVLLRPIVQDALFPTVAYVAGPNELAYLGQLREVYEHFGLPMPLMYPRATATLVDSAAVRFINRYDVPLESLQRADEARLNELLEAQLPPAVDRALQDASAAIDGAHGRASLQRCRRSTRRSKAPRDRRSAGCSTI